MSNPLLQNLRLPGETVRLPSLGLFYKHGEIDTDNGEVHVYPMSAIDELTMRNISKLINGDSIIEVCANCVPAIKNPKELFSKDIDLLLLMLRKVTYGPDITVKYTHTCQDAKEHTYTTSIDSFIQNTKYINPTKINDSYTIVMENGQVVKLNPIKFKDVLSLMQDASINTPKIDDTNSVEFTDMQIKLQEKMIESTIKIIASVDNIDDKEMIGEWARKIPTSWFKKISNAIDDASDFGPSTSFEITCNDCGATFNIDIELNPLTFFL
jgi:hypothetical protein